MDNNNKSDSNTSPQNGGSNAYAASESIIRPEATAENNLSQTLGTPPVTPTPVAQSLGTPLVTPTPATQSLREPIATPTPVAQPQPITPSTLTAPVNLNPATTTITPLNDENLSTDTKKRPKMIKKIVLVMASILFFGVAIGGSYLFGKSHEKVVIQEPELKPINLPPQAVVLSECAVGRGKQYILPKDIPIGPIYDVVNSKVVAIEYSLDLIKLLDGSDFFSDTILSLVSDYPVNHLSIIPDNPNPAALKRIQLIMFVVPKEEANKITCT